MAAGLSIQPERIGEFRRALSRSVQAMLGQAPPRPPLQIEAYLGLDEINLELVADLERLALERSRVQAGEATLPPAALLTAAGEPLDPSAAYLPDGTLAYLGVVPLGGNAITCDLQALRVPWDQAEKLKTDWAVASNELVDPNQSTRVMRLGGRGTFSISHAVVSQVAGQRVEEIFEVPLTRREMSLLARAAAAANGWTERLPGDPGGA